jgi:putative transcriptional regulator
MTDVAPGTLLISDPFLKDPNFMRTVVFLCEHTKDGSFGFVLNKVLEQQIGDLLIDAEGIRFPVYNGGPVQRDTIHFLHQRPHDIGGFEVTDGIFWGGDFEKVLALLKEGELTTKDIRFFLGYSGWGEGQLAGELEEKSWITREANKRFVFDMNTPQIWKASLTDLGGEYSQMVNYPIDPQLN